MTDILALLVCLVFWVFYLHMRICNLLDRIEHIEGKEKE